jgi:transmembrane sensor
LNQHYHTPLEDLLVKYLLQEASPEERRRVDLWLAADPANQRHFDDLRLIWEKSSRASLPDIEGEEETAWQALHEKLQKPARRTPIRAIRWTAIATTAAAAIAIFLWWRSTPVTMQQIASGNAIRIDTLADGSIVTLNKHSSLSQPSTFAGKERIVSLQGEAFFQIAPDKNRPFRVQVNGMTITVLGTSFNVRTQNKKTIILVETGLIEVKNRKTGIRVAAGETTTLDLNDPTPQKQPAGTDVYKYYQPRVFVCRDTPLGELADALNQAYGDSIMIATPALRQLPITTTFHNESLPTILGVISATLNIKVQSTGNGYILEKK